MRRISGTGGVPLTRCASRRQTLQRRHQSKAPRNPAHAACHARTGSKGSPCMARAALLYIIPSPLRVTPPNRNSQTANGNPILNNNTASQKANVLYVAVSQQQPSPGNIPQPPPPQKNTKHKHSKPYHQGQMAKPHHQKNFLQASNLSRPPDVITSRR